MMINYKRHPIHKLDEPLLEIFNDTTRHEEDLHVQVIIRCAAQNGDAIQELLIQLGGEIRHRLRVIPAICALMPVASLLDLVKDERVNAVELNQRFTIGAGIPARSRTSQEGE
jgi:hypothetical protein